MQIVANSWSIVFTSSVRRVPFISDYKTLLSKQVWTRSYDCYASVSWRFWVSGRVCVSLFPYLQKEGSCTPPPPYIYIYIYTEALAVYEASAPCVSLASSRHPVRHRCVTHLCKIIFALIHTCNISICGSFWCRMQWWRQIWKISTSFQNFFSKFFYV